MNTPEEQRRPYFDRATRPVPDGQAPAWAGEYGVDDYGPWASMAIVSRHSHPPVVQKFRWIPPGGFWMGSPDDEYGRFEDEGPRHWVTITSGFWLGATPVTQGLWTAVMGSNPSHFTDGEPAQVAQRPVESVSFDGVQRFLATLNKEPEGAGWRLPTETEWEYACRAGSAGELPWIRTAAGDGKPAANRAAVAWFGPNSGDTTHPVGRLQANALGLYDMQGNVWEWCDSQRVPYQPWDRFHDPSFPEFTFAGARVHRVLRGGSWDYAARGVRPANRSARSPEDAWKDIGFRLARGPG